MKIKVYIVTYKNDRVLALNLDSLKNSDLMEHQHQITIINNHSEFGIDIDSYNKDWFNLKVVHNDVRPDFSTGYLARDWNFALVDGFQKLHEPDCDIVVACQNDTVFFPDWVSHLLKYHEVYNFVHFGIGDNFMSWTPDGVRKIGLFDERYCATGHQELDYFNMAVLLNPDGTSINDKHGHSNGHWNCVLDETKDWPPNNENPLTRDKLLELKEPRTNPWCNCSNKGLAAINPILDMKFSSADDNKPLQSGGGYGIAYRTVAPHMHQKWHDFAFLKFWYWWDNADDLPCIRQRSWLTYPFFEWGLDVDTLRKRNISRVVIKECLGMQKRDDT